MISFANSDGCRSYLQGTVIFNLTSPFVDGDPSRDDQITDSLILLRLGCFGLHRGVRPKHTGPSFLFGFRVRICLPFPLVLGR